MITGRRRRLGRSTVFSLLGQQPCAAAALRGSDPAAPHQSLWCTLQCSVQARKGRRACSAAAPCRLCLMADALTRLSCNGPCSEGTRHSRFCSGVSRRPQTPCMNACMHACQRARLLDLSLRQSSHTHTRARALLQRAQYALAQAQATTTRILLHIHIHALTTVSHRSMTTYIYVCSLVLVLALPLPRCLSHT